MGAEEPTNRVLCLLTIALLACAVSCNRGVPQPAGKRYHLKGTVVSVDKENGRVTVDHEDIPSFMPAMTMPYSAKPVGQLDQLVPGDIITADVVAGENGHWLENITVVQHAPSSPAKPAVTLHIPTEGELVPNFHFTNQSGKRISIDRYRGQALLVTFIYTRCPFADYCPRVSSEFAEINRDIFADPSLRGKIHLLSLSFDPAHDSPVALRDYGYANAGDKRSSLFGQWEFAVVSASDLPEIAHYFGLSYEQQQGTISHSLSTTVIGPDGKIVRWYHGNEWQAADLLRDAARALGITT